MRYDFSPLFRSTVGFDRFFNLIDNLESKTSDARLVTMELQNAGITNWFGNSAQGNLEYLNSDDRSSHLTDERINHVKELLSQDELQLEVLEAQGINTDGLAIPQTIPEDNEIQDEGYIQKDQDREDEGGDDADDERGSRLTGTWACRTKWNDVREDTKPYKSYCAL